tara:strand:- start:62 stop:1036 length:975 start_codon:yes stop_codon:yes gene_type:complete
MPFKKYISIIIKIVIVFFSFYFIYKQLLENKSFEELNLDLLLNILIQNKGLVLLVVFLMFVNWLFEALKWRYMIRKIENISISRSVRAVFSGITVSTFTPNRIGEYGGRVFCLEKGDRIKAVFITILCSMSQLLTTVIFGSISLLLLKNDILLDTTFFKFLDIKILSFFLIISNLIFLISYYNVAFIVNLFNRFKSLKNFYKYLEVLSLYNYKDLSINLLCSIIRYCVFTIQFILLLNIFNVDIEFLEALLSVMLIFLFITVTPTITIAEIGVRGTVALFVLGIFSSNTIGILSAVSTLWLINLILPAIIGTVFIFSLKFFRIT